MKPDIYEQVTDRIITQLESGVVPWKSPYFSKVGFPRNFSTGRAYQGINVLLLGSLRFDRRGVGQDNSARHGEQARQVHALLAR